jgi:uncharacterized membrane protein
MASVIAIQSTWLILGIICFIIFIVILTFYLTTSNTTQKEGYNLLLNFGLHYILPIGIAFIILYLLVNKHIDSTKKRVSAKSAQMRGYTSVT